MLLDIQSIESLIKKSNLSLDKRSHLLLHETVEDDMQQIAFCIQPETLIDVHKHSRGTETIVCLKGSMAVTFIHENELQAFKLNSENPILKFNPTQWHTYTSLEKDTVGFEIKEGPYDKGNFIHHEILNDLNNRIELNEKIRRKVR